MKDTIKGIITLLWLLIIGPMVAIFLYEALKSISMILAFLIMAVVYFGLLVFFVYWAEKE